MRTTIIPAVIGLAAVCAASNGAIVTVSAHGTVIFNGVTGGALGGVSAGAGAVMSFQVDSDVFVTGVPGDTRGYEIIQPSFSLSFTTPTAVGLLNPFPAGQTPYFTLVDGFPVSDGFFVSTSPVSPGGVPLAQTPLQANFDVGYVGTTLSSLDILDAVGTYDFTGLTRFSFTLWQVFPENVRMEIDFSQLTIVPAPSALATIGALGLWGGRRRRR